jgi:protease I
MAKKSKAQTTHHHRGTHKNLNGVKIAILATEGVEQSELTEPRMALLESGADVVLVSPVDEVQMFKHHDKGDVIKADLKLDQADPAEFDALVLPGGVANPDQLRMNRKAVDFVKSFASEDKPIAAICHGPWLLVEADIARGHRVTSWPSLKTDLRNAGAEWTDETVVRDGKLVTSRNPKDIPNFNREMIDLFASESATKGAQARKPETTHASPAH